MKAILLAVSLFSLPGVSLAESDTGHRGELSAAQIKSMRQAGSAVLTARANATEDPGVAQFRQDIQALRQELQALAALPIAATAVKSKQNATKQRVRNAMTRLRDVHTQMKQRKRPKGRLPDTEVMNKVTAKLAALQTELDVALSKPDAELHAACKTLLTRLETQHLMIGQPLDDQPTLSTRTHHRR